MSHGCTDISKSTEGSSVLQSKAQSDGNFEDLPPGLVSLEVNLLSKMFFFFLMFEIENISLLSW